MVKKLFKHELQYYIRSLLPMYIVLAGVALIGRFIEFFESDTTAYSIMRGSSVFMLVVACLAVVGLTMLFSIVRYYKNLFTGEGYLTLTLPVSTRAHILVKLGSALVANVASLIAVVLAVCLFTVGPWLVEIVKAVSYIVEQIAREFYGHFGWYVLECVPLLLMSLTAQLLLYYMCISLGQLFRKNRVLAAVGVYFALYVITQILSTVLMIAVTVFGALDWLYQIIDNMTRDQILGWTHGLIWLGFAGWGVMSVVYYLISKVVITKRLNLE